MSTNTNSSTNLKLSGNFLGSQHPQSQTPTTVQQIAQPQSSSTPNNILPLAVKPSHPIGISNPSVLQQNQQTIPSRYHPPPQSVGILKPPLSNSTKSHVPNPHFPLEFGAPQLNIKYPPDVPKISSSIYFADQIKTNLPSVQNTQQRYNPVPPNRPPQIRLPPGAVQHHPPPPQNPPQAQIPASSVHRLTPAGEELLAARLTANHLQQAAVQQGQDMLKFVRKADSDTSTTTSSNSGRLSVEQPTKQYVQVSTNYLDQILLPNFSVILSKRGSLFYFYET